MEVESTHVHVRPDGKKLIDVTLRRQGAPPQQAPLVVPRFEDDSSSSSDSSDSDSEDVTAKRAIAVSTLSRRKSPTSSSSNNNGKDEEEPADETGADGDKEKPSLPRQTFQGELQWDSVQEIQQLTNANAQHVAQVRDLRQQVKALQIQLEAQTPVPGLDVDVVQGILLDKDNIDHDVRDVKIVHQAKSLRALKRSLQREKQLAADAAKQCKLMEAAKQQLEQEVDTLQLKLQRFQVRAAAANHANAISLAVTPGDNNNQQQTPDSPTPSSSDSGSDSGALRKLCEELKVKNVALQQELKKTQRALVREVGDDVAWDEVLTNTNAASGASRRGRAQHIIMLKAKVKKLQAQLVATKSDSVATKPQDAGTTLDVDQRAQQDLSGQHMHRQKLLDQLTTQRDELEERVHRVTRKYDAIKARASTLDREKQETRSKFQVLVEKSRTDDALVDALQRQLETWKAKLHEARRARTADSGGKGGSANQEERGELERLRKVVAAHKSGGGDRLMPQPSEISQYRAIAAEKERLTEVVSGLKAQLEAKDKQLRAMQQPPGGPALTASALPALGDDGASRIPRRPGSMIPPPGGRGLSTGNMAALGPPPPAAVAMEQQQQQLKHEMETLRRTFRQSLREKDERIADLQRQQEHQSADSGRVDENAMSQELQELQEENAFLRHEFDKLKARYEAVVRPPSGSGKKKPHGKAQ